MYYIVLIKEIIKRRKPIMFAALTQFASSLCGVIALSLFAPVITSLDSPSKANVSMFVVVLLCATGFIVFGKIARSKAGSAGFDLSLAVLDGIDEDLAAQIVIEIIHKIRRIPQAINRYLAGIVFVSVAITEIVVAQNVSWPFSVSVALLMFLRCYITDVIGERSMGYSNVAAVVAHAYNKKATKIDRILSSAYQAWCATANTNFMIGIAASILILFMGVLSFLGALKMISAGTSIVSAAVFYAAILLCVQGLFYFGLSLYDGISLILHANKDYDDSEEDKQDAIGELPRANMTASIALQGASYITQEGEHILRNINFSIKSGYKVGIVTTNRKTSKLLCDILCAKKQLSSGHVLIDDVVVDLRFISSSVSLISSDITWTLDTIKNNIGRNASDTTFDDVMKLSLLVDFVGRGTQREYEIIAPTDPILTPFRRKCISLARAMLSNTNIVVVDDLFFGAPTSSDENLLRVAIRQFLNYRTSVAITTNPTFVSDFDTIIMIDRGEIVEFGDHQSLVCNGGVYANLYMQYFGGERNLH